MGFALGASYSVYFANSVVAGWEMALASICTTLAKGVCRMETTMSSLSQQIGDVAGQIWHALHENGRLSQTKLVKVVDAPRDMVMQGLGWLAREDKIEIEETSRGRVISLK
jgi:hypothetical protein